MLYNVSMGAIRFPPLRSPSTYAHLYLVLYNLIPCSPLQSRRCPAPAHQGSSRHPSVPKPTPSPNEAPGNDYSDIHLLDFMILKCCCQRSDIVYKLWDWPCVWLCAHLIVCTCGGLRSTLDVISQVCLPCCLKQHHPAVSLGRPVSKTQGFT